MKKKEKKEKEKRKKLSKNYTRILIQTYNKYHFLNFFG